MFAERDESSAINDTAEAEHWSGNMIDEATAMNDTIDEKQSIIDYKQHTPSTQEMKFNSKAIAFNIVCCRFCNVPSTNLAKYEKNCKNKNGNLMNDVARNKIEVLVPEPIYVNIEETGEPRFMCGYANGYHNSKTLACELNHTYSCDHTKAFPTLSFQ